MLATLQNCIENPKSGCLLFDTHQHTLFLQHAFPLLHSGYSVGAVSKSIINALNLAVQNTAVTGIYRLKHSVNSPSILCFSSGTKDTQKGIVRSLNSWNESFRCIQNELIEYPKAKAVVLGSLPYSLSLFGAMESLNRGVAPLIFPTNTLRDISRISPDEDCVLWISPAHASFFSDAFENETLQPMVGVRYVFVGGAHFSNQQRSRLQSVFPNARIYSFYGASETSFISIKPPEDTSESVGTICEGVQLSILDEKHQECPTNTTGKVWVNSNQRFDSYTQKSLKINTLGNFISTNDKGFVDSENRLFFTGRSERLISIRGHIIDLYLLEKWFKQALKIEEIALLAVPNKQYKNQLILVSQTQLSDVVWQALKVNATNAHGSQGVPKKWVHCPEWPLLANGKVDEQQLKSFI